MAKDTLGPSAAPARPTSSPSPKKWDANDKVLTRLARDYSRIKTNIDSSLEMEGDWDKLKDKALKRNKLGGAAGCWAQIMRGKGFKAPGEEGEGYIGDRVNLFVDLDDRLPSLEEAESKTREMVKWALEELPALLEPYGVDPTPAWVKGNIAISVMPGQDPDYKRDIAKLVKDGNAAAAKLRGGRQHGCREVAGGRQRGVDRVVAQGGPGDGGHADRSGRRERLTAQERRLRWL